MAAPAPDCRNCRAAPRSREVRAGRVDHGGNDPVGALRTRQGAPVQDQPDLSEGAPTRDPGSPPQRPHGSRRLRSGGRLRGSDGRRSAPLRGRELEDGPQAAVESSPRGGPAHPLAGVSGSVAGDGDRIRNLFRTRDLRSSSVAPGRRRVARATWVGLWQMGRRRNARTAHRPCGLRTGELYPAGGYIATAILPLISCPLGPSRGHPTLEESAPPPSGHREWTFPEAKRPRQERGAR